MVLQYWDTFIFTKKKINKAVIVTYGDTPKSQMKVSYYIFWILYVMYNMNISTSNEEC